MNANTENFGFKKAIAEIVDLIFFLQFNLENLAKITEVNFTTAVNEKTTDLSLDEQTRELISTILSDRHAQFLKEDAHTYIAELAIVRLWSIFEAGLDDFAIYILSHPRLMADSEEVQKIKANALEFLLASPVERGEYLLDELKRSIKLPEEDKNSVGRSEALLKALKLGGGLDNNVRKSLIEFSEIRNAIVHKSGLVDKHFVARCPWLNLKQGEKVNVSLKEFLGYALSIMFYIVEISSRTHKRADELKVRMAEGGATPEQLQEFKEIFKGMINPN